MQPNRQSQEIRKRVKKANKIKQNRTTKTNYTRTLMVPGFFLLPNLERNKTHIVVQNLRQHRSYLGIPIRPVA
jgi:hypothetical protein